VVLPADAIGDVGRNRLIDQQMLDGERRRTQHQQDDRHAEEPRPGGRQQRFRPAFRHQRHHLANEDRYHHVEQRNDHADRKQANEQRFGLPGEMPIESGQAGWRLCTVRHRGRCE
jgi:hypothetical protein